MALEVNVVGENLECLVDEKRLWSIPIASIVLIAECTTNQGPWLDDWYLVIKFFEQGCFVNVQIHDSVIGGFSVLLRALGERMNSKLELGLVSVTEWNSRVIWPETIQGERYFTLDPIVPVGLWETLKRRCFGPSLSLALTEPVREYLRQYETTVTESGSHIGRR